MNGMLTLVFTALMAVAAAGEMIPPNAPAKPSGTCVPELALCTGPVVLGGKETKLTYVCPETSEPASTIHVTVTATTTVTLPADGPVKTSTSVDPVATSTQPGPKPESDTTTTIRTTSTQLKTITVTHKASSSAISKVSTASTDIESIETLITATSMFGWPTPAFPSSTLASSSSSSSAKSDHTEGGITLLPPPTQSSRSSSLWTPSTLPPIVTGVPSSGFSLPQFPSKTTHHSHPWGTGSPSVRPSGTGFRTHSSDRVDALPIPRPTGYVSSGHVPIPPQPTHSWHFPTLHQIRDVNATATLSAMPSSHTGGAGQVGVSVAVLFGAVVAAAYMI